MGELWQQNSDKLRHLNYAWLVLWDRIRYVPRKTLPMSLPYHHQPELLACYSEITYSEALISKCKICIWDSSERIMGFPWFSNDQFPQVPKRNQCSLLLLVQHVFWDTFLTCSNLAPVTMAQSYIFPILMSDVKTNWSSWLIHCAAATCQTGVCVCVSQLSKVGLLKFFYLF